MEEYERKGRGSIIDTVLKLGPELHRNLHVCLGGLLPQRALRLQTTREKTDLYQSLPIWGHPGSPCTYGSCLWETGTLQQRQLG